ncbi:SigE family RNA polymerase sigma factor [Dactylosporangium siamense]|uniref:RNA polymerase sigma factor n=1 Tax=Dactylosporangium siamense TaxID=685454 RepID=A0A919U6Q8_9ACTN|nr:SigE family RNA polymerase sigma factor [Dactylosporangium siamense]GIG43737.1 RNA polymerase sigma factor [Dactylosporangium siamense]
MDQSGEQRYREFVVARSAALLCTAYLLVGDRGRAEDLLQTALVKTYIAWDRIKDPGATEAYVRRVMATTATSWWRRRWSAERPAVSLPDSAVADASGELADADEMRRLLLTLPARQRAVLVLRYYDDMSEADVAEMLGISRSAVSSYATRGLSALRHRIGEEINSL